MTLTAQHYFTETVKYLREQSTRSTTTTNQGIRCVYLTDCGNKCAVGYWIPDGHPAQQHRGSARYLLEMHPDLDGVAFPEGAVRLATRLQALHDTEANRDPFTGGGLSEEGESEARRIAADLGLTYSPPEATA